MMDGDEAIAIVGVGCRYPGANNNQEFWELLRNGEDYIREIPLQRWNNEAFYDADPDAKGKLYATKGAFIEDIDGFDNNFFGISPAEAKQMDPQQKLVLECVHMAFEDGGFTRRNLDGSKTGVYIGSMNFDQLSMYMDTPEDMINYTLTGMDASIMANRVSYQYNLHGPSMTINTACSSGLVATHQAISALREGDIDLAVCGAVSLMQLPFPFVGLSRARMLSKTGKSHAFSADADGYTRGEGCGVVILKRLKEALHDNDRVWGVIVTGCNQDGRMARPITAPSGIQQLELLKSLYGKFNINPADIQYIEAHGTGTPIGDPVEFNSLGSFFTNAMKEAGQMRLISVGSVKTNVGHGEPVAGITGLIKVLLMMEHGEMVRSLHFTKDRANPELHLEDYSLDVVTSNTKWQKQQDGSRMACVCAYGFGGTNTHAVVKQIHLPNQHTNSEKTDEPFIVAFSAKTTDSLKNTLQHFCEEVQHERQNLENISYTSTCRRDHFAKRLAVCSSTLDDLTKNVEHAQKHYRHDSIQLAKEKRVCFVFSGVGTTWTGMCNDLINVPVFRNTIERIDTILQGRTCWSILEIFSTSDPSVVDDPFVGHICIFACQVALASLWKSFGITPTAIVGMSVGEVAATYISDVLNLEDATNVIFERSKSAAQAIGGTMCVVCDRNIDEVEIACSQTENRASIAMQISPVACTVSGDVDAIHDVKKLLRTGSNPEAYFVKDLNVKCAYHSHCMEESSQMLFKSLSDFPEIQPNNILYSSVSGHKAMPGDFSTPLYWKRNLRERVKFQQALQIIHKETECNVFIEIGPRPTLKSHMENIFPEKDVEKMCLPSMQRGHGYKTLLESLSILYMAGLDPIWENVQNHEDKCISQIPKYQFVKVNMSSKPEKTAMRLLGISSHDSDHLFTKRTVEENTIKVVISPETTKFAYDHYVEGNIVVPGALYAEIGLAVSRIVFDNNLENYEISVNFRKPLKLNDKKGFQIVVDVQKDESGESLDFIVKFKNQILAEGKVKKQTKKGTLFVRIDDLKNQMTHFFSMEETYKLLKSLGFEYGPSLKSITGAYTFYPEVVCEVTIEKSVLGELKQTHLHPTIVDAMFQATAILLQKGQVKNDLSGITIVPSGIHRLILKGRPQERMMLAAKILKRTDDSVHANMLLMDLDGKVIVEIEDFHSRIFKEMFRINDGISYEMVYKELRVDDLAICSAEHTHNYVLVASDNKNETVQKVANILSDHSYHMVQFNSDEQIKEDDISKHLEHEGVKSLEDTTLLLFPSGSVTNDENCGMDVFTRVKHSCLVFMNLLKYLIRNNIDIPIIIVTNNTKILGVISDTNEPIQYLTNVIGSELWGMARCVISELSYRSVMLVDVDNEDMSILLDILCTCSRTIPTHISELRIQKGSLYQISFQRQRSALDDPVEFKQTLYDHSIQYPVEMRSSNCHCIQEPFFVMKQPDNFISKPGYVQIAVETAYLTNGKTLPFTKTASMEGLDIWQQEHVNGHSILTFEIVGRKVEGNGCSSAKGQTNRLVGLYPLVICNKVSIPEHCTCSVDEIPSDSLGRLRQSALLWSITSSVPSHSSVCIFHKEDHPHILEEMLQVRRVKELISISTQSYSEWDIQQDILVLLTAVPNRWIKKILKCSKNVTKIISIRPYLSREQELFIHDKSSTVDTIVLEINEIFSENSLEKLAPELFQWLKKSMYVFKHEEYNARSEIRSDKKNPSVVEFSRSPLDMDDAVLATDVNVRTYKSQLFQKTATYVVVGGLTGLGWEIVLLLAERRAGHIVTFSRRKPSPDILIKMEKLQMDHGCTVVSEQCDVTDINSLKKSFANIKNITSAFPLKGIFHGAAVFEDAVILNQTMETFDRVLKAKVLGTWNLHQFTRKLNLDYFVMHSSITSVFGNPGQSNYAAANSFMDSFAHFRKDRGLAGTAINWGTLNVGMAVSSDALKQKLKLRGMQLLCVEDIRSCLLVCLLSPKPQALCAAMDWSLLSNRYAMSKKAKYDTVFEDQLDKTKKPYEMYQKFSASELQQMTSSDRRNALIQIVESITRDAMMIDEELSGSQKLSELDIDSFQSMTIINRIHELTLHKVPLFNLLDSDASIDTVVDNLADYFDQIEESKKDGDTISQTISPMEDNDVTVQMTGGMHFAENKEEPLMNTQCDDKGSCKMPTSSSLTHDDSQH